MSISRRAFVTDASALSLMMALLPELAVADTPASPSAFEDTPHDSYHFWNGFYDSVNPSSKDYGHKSASRGPKDQLPDPACETQYLHYKTDTKILRYATDISKDELLNHDGDVGVSIALSQYHPAAGNSDSTSRAVQLRLDTTQIHPYMNVIAPLAWTAIASLEPNNAGTVSLEQLGFRSPSATQGTSKILLNQGTGKLAVNVSKAASNSVFVKALNIMVQGAKVVAPMVTLPAISVPALSAFSEVLSYWEDRTRFIMAGNLTTALATQQAFNDPDREDRYMGLVSGAYLMIPQQHVEELAKLMPNLDLEQGYLVRKDADPKLPLAARADSAVPGITYASMNLTVQPIDSAFEKKPGSTGSSSSSPKKSITTKK